MTRDKDFKRAVRARSSKTGERYAAARSKLAGDGGAVAAGDGGAPADGDAALAFVRDQHASALQNFHAEFRPQLEGLTDDEYLWQPVAGCPTVRARDDGKFYEDHQFPVHGVATIGQRLSWVSNVLLNRTNQHFGDKSLTTSGPVPRDASGGLALFDRAFDGWLAGVQDCDPGMLRRHSQNTTPGAADGMFPFVSVLEFMFQLLVQCASHVSMTRGLYSARTP